MTGPQLTRRTLLKAGAAASFVLGFRLPMARAAEESFAPNAFIRIATNGDITLIIPQAEMGQGVYTSMSQVLAEELDADFARVRVEPAPPNDKLYANPILGIQITGNSNSIRGFWDHLRSAGATARAMLIEAAARRWAVDAPDCRTLASVVIHDASSRRFDYGALAEAAAKVDPPKNPPLKAVKDFSIIGRPVKRLDVSGKVDGTARFGIDALPTGVKFASLIQSPVKGGKIRKVGDAAARRTPGVRQIVILDDLVAVIGDNTWAAMRGLDALNIEWDDGPNGTLNSEQVWSELRAASEQPGVIAKAEGEADPALRDGDQFDAAYEMPFLAHAPMEPVNCVAHVTPGHCELWLGTQVMTKIQGETAKALGLPPEAVTVHQHLLGGGFGRRLEWDMAVTAARIAEKVEGPVKVTWSREEDIRHDAYRPVYRDLLSASLKDGRINGWVHRVTGSAIFARRLPRLFQNGIDKDAMDGAVDVPYAIPNLRVEYVRKEPGVVTTGFWRGVGANNNVFAIESFIDELAQKAGVDPAAFRLSMLDKTPRLQNAVRLAAERSGWGSPLPPRVGRGIAAQVAFGSFIATVCEAEVDTYGEVRVRRIVSAVDTGIAVNPDTIVAQLQGGLIFGLTAALFGEITIANGRVQQSNFHDYRMLRINEVPSIDIHIIPSEERPGGIGETGTTASAPSLGNAIFAATGIRLRRLPIDREVLSGRKPA